MSIQINEILGSYEIERITRLLPLLYSQLDLDELAAQTVRLLSSLIECDMIAYSEVNPQLRRSVNALDSVEAQADATIFEPIFEKHMHEHPLINNLLENPSAGVCKISDFLTIEQWHNTGLYREFFTLVGIEHQIILPLHATPPVLTAVTFNRTTSDFTEHDRALLEWMRPHVAQAYQNAAKLASLSESLTTLESSLDALGVGLMCVNNSFIPVRMTQYAGQCMNAFFPETATAHQLPSVVSDWLQATLMTTKAPQTLYIHQDHGRLRFRMVPGQKEGELLLSLDRQMLLSNIGRLRSLAVSRREAEILFWIAQGKPNPEIGITLNISPRTVSTHVETILKKLNVNSRTAAAVVAVECLLDGS